MTQTTTPGSPAPAAPALPDPRPLAALAVRHFAALVGRVPADAWGRSTAGHVSASDPSADLTLRQVLGQHAYDDAWIPAMLAGRTMAEVGEDAFTGDLLGDDPAGRSAALAAAGEAAIGEVADLGRTVHCSFGDFSTGDYLWQVVAFRGLRAVEVARFLGEDAQLPAELVDGLTAYFLLNAEQWREWGVLGAEVPAPEGATAQERLLALTGIRPR
ncbi:hypothetical protein NUM3379_16460 [Kineococcus sp. NUM-3379]